MYYKLFAEEIMGRFIYAGGHPAINSDQCYKNLLKLKDEGIQTIISLESLNFALISSPWCSFGDEYKHLSHSEKVSFFIEDFKAPTTTTLEAIVDTMMNHINNKKKIYIHCRAGLGRTGTVLAALLIKVCNQTAEDAILYVRNNYSPYAIEVKSQEEVLRKLEGQVIRGPRNS